MEDEALVEQFFQQSIGAKIDCVDAVAVPLVQAGVSLATSLLAEGKVLVCGDGSSALIAQFFAASMMNQGEHERPGLPVLALDNSSALLGAIEGDYGVSDGFARQVRALGQVNDCLVLFTCTGESSSMLAAVSAAHERDMMVVAISAQSGGHLPALLSERDVLICVPSASRFRIHENHLLLSFALCELVERQMFGGL